MDKSLYVDELKTYLSEKNIINTNELLDFYRNFNKGLSVNALRLRVWELKKQDIIYSPKRGSYSLNTKENFLPTYNEDMEKIANLIKNNFPYVKFTIYSSNWINNLSTHIYQNHNIIVEIDADVLNSAFNLLRNNYENTFISPSQEMYDNYISPKDTNIIVNRLYVDAPLQTIKSEYLIPKIEKLIVDLIINKPILYTINQSEINKIIQNTFEKYNINRSTINRYARKRNLGKNILDKYLI